MEIEGFQRLADIVEKSVEWIWEDRIPIGELTIIEGDPGVNKSSLCCDLAARLTQGTAMPHTAAKGRPRKGGVLFLIGEDSIAKTVVGRLRAAGADLSKIAVLDGVGIPGDLDRLEKAIREIGAKLVVVDTITDFVNGSESNNQAIRRALHPLRELAERMQVAVVIIRHFTKKASGKSLFRGAGSMGITAVVRSQLKIFKHPSDEHLRVLVQDKLTMGPLSAALLFEVVSNDDGQFRLECRGDTDLTIADLEGSKGGGSKLAAAEKFLLEKLADGPKDVNWLVEQVKQAKDISKRTLDEAKKNLGIDTDRKGRRKDQIVSWVLPTVAEPEKQHAKAATRAKKPASKEAASKTPRSKAPKVYVPKTSKYEIE